MKQLLPIVNETVIKGITVYDTEDFLELESRTNDRSRFKSLTDFIRKLDRMSAAEYSEHFISHFYIKAANINDARLAMIVIYQKLAQKDPMNIGRYIVHAGSFPVSPETDPFEAEFPSESSFWGVPPAADRAFGENIDDITDILNPRVIEAGSFIDSDADIQAVCTYYRVVFVINVQGAKKEPEMPMPFSFGPPRRNYDELTERSDFNCIEISGEKSPSDCFDEMLDSYFTDSGFDTDNVRELISEAAASPDIDEYALGLIAKKVISEHALEGSGKTLDPVIFKRVMSRFCKSAPKNAVSGQSVKIIGLKEEQKKLNGIVNMLRLAELRREKGISSAPVGCNLVFAGPPGTAKTTLARYFAAMLEKNGLIKSAENFKECRKSDIVGAYVGWTAKMIDGIFSEMYDSGGGVIFFDEIYTLSEEHSTIFDKEAVTAITQNMENYREKVYCIFAGYPGKMNEFLSANPGMRSRIQFNIRFREYDTETLNDIFRSMAGSGSYKLPRGYSAVTAEYFNKLRRLRGEQFGNGREARNLYENCVEKLAERVCSSGGIPSSAALTTFRLRDIKGAVSDIIGFDASVSGSGSKLDKIGFC